MSSEAGKARIFQINISSGGVPKLAVRTVRVLNEGLEGDQHRDLVHHGGPERAVCLFSLERIQQLQVEGHPIFPGSAGENVTLSGVAWEEMIPGKRLQLGAGVILEITRFTEPCGNIRHSFSNLDSQRIAQDKYPGWSRVYARVIQGGDIVTGDAVSLL